MAMSLSCMSLSCDCEPTLQDLLDDPVTELVMRRDGVAREEIESLIARQREARSEPEAA